MAILDYFPHIKNRIIQIDDEELLMYNLKYSTEFVVIDIRIPKQIIHTKHESGGVLFRAEEFDFIDNSDSIALTTKVEPIRGYSDFADILLMYPDSYGEFKTSMIWYKMSHTKTLDTIKDFNKFWKVV